MTTMDNSTPAEQSPQAYITRYALNNWTGTTIWAIIFSGLGLLITLVWASSFFMNMDKIALIAENADVMGILPLFKVIAANIQWILIVLLALSAFMHIMHLRYAILLRHSISQEKQENFEAAWNSLRHFFRIQGILTVCMFVFYAYTTYQYIMLYRKMLNMMHQMN